MRIRLQFRVSKGSVVTIYVPLFLKLALGANGLSLMSGMEDRQSGEARAVLQHVQLAGDPTEDPGRAEDEREGWAFMLKWD